MHNTSSNWLIYGANGYTGELITRFAVERGLKPILAGRNESKIAELAGKYGFEHRAFSLEDAAAPAPSRAACFERPRLPKSGTRCDKPTMVMVIGSMLSCPLLGTLSSPNSNMGGAHAPACGTLRSAATAIARWAASIGFCA